MQAKKAVCPGGFGVSRMRTRGGRSKQTKKPCLLWQAGPAAATTTQQGGGRHVHVSGLPMSWGCVSATSQFTLVASGATTWDERADGRLLLQLAGSLLPQAQRAPPSMPFPEPGSALILLLLLSSCSVTRRILHSGSTWTAQGPCRARPALPLLQVYTCVLLSGFTSYVGHRQGSQGLKRG